MRPDASPFSLAGFRFDVFDVDSCGSQQQLEAYLPGIGQVLQAPAVGVWLNGVLLGAASGYPGRLLAYRACGLDAGAGVV